MEAHRRYNMYRRSNCDRWRGYRLAVGNWDAYIPFESCHHHHGRDDCVCMRRRTEVGKNPLDQAFIDDLYAQRGMLVTAWSGESGNRWFTFL